MLLLYIDLVTSNRSKVHKYAVGNFKLKAFVL